MKIRRIKVFEGGTLTIDSDSLLRRDLETLDRFEEANGLQAFQVGLKKVRIGGYVGIFAAGDLVIEILPKAEPKDTPENGALYRKWSSAFLRMLSVVYDLPLNDTGLFAQENTEGSLLEIFISHFLDEAETLARHGLARGYRRTVERRTSVCGKIVTAGIGIESIVHKEQLLCEFDVYDKATIHNRLIASALAALHHLPISMPLAERARRISEVYPEPGAIKPTERLFDNLALDRRTMAYTRALEYSRLILLRFVPAQRPGDRESLSLLFKMNDLFEGFIGTLVRRAACRRGWRASLQSSKRFWERQTIRPDIILETPRGRLILDTKWKVLRTAVPSVEDVRQMYAYNRFFHADRALLIYPQVYDLPNRTGLYHDPEHELSCGLFFVPLFENGTLISSLGESILADIEVLV